MARINEKNQDRDERPAPFDGSIANGKPKTARDAGGIQPVEGYIDLLLPAIAQDDIAHALTSLPGDAWIGMVCLHILDWPALHSQDQVAGVQRSAPIPGEVGERGW